ncbi:MAG: hypothetical protein GY830_02060 [Bacteroidetes bacterium]|nr:hypothetical protein [Bacteroidota bacterium]
MLSFKIFLIIKSLLVNLEDLNIYEQNLHFLTTCIENKQKFEKFYDESAKILKFTKEIFYSPKIQQIELLEQKYTKKDFVGESTDFLDFLLKTYISFDINIKDYPQIKLFKDMQEFTSKTNINELALSQETRYIISILKTQLSQDDFEHLLSKQVGVNFYHSLSEILKNNKEVLPLELKNLYKYLELLELQKNQDLTQLFA